MGYCAGASQKVITYSTVYVFEMLCQGDLLILEHLPLSVIVFRKASTECLIIQVQANQGVYVNQVSIDQD